MSWSAENVKEMNSPTRDGHAMIAAGLIAPDGADGGIGVAASRHHRRCSRLEPTGEFERQCTTLALRLTSVGG